MASFETSEAGTVVLVAIDGGEGAEGRDPAAAGAARRIVLHAYPPGYHASRAAHPSQRVHRN